MPLETGIQIILGPILSNKNRLSIIYFNLEPPDLVGNNSGLTQAVRVYRDGTNVNLTAPVVYEGRKFRFWQINRNDGSSELFTERNIFIYMNQNILVKCIYESSDLYSYVETVMGVIGYKSNEANGLETGIEIEIL